MAYARAREMAENSRELALGEDEARALVPQGSPGPQILDYSYTTMNHEYLAEALANQPAKVFRSVVTILACNNTLTQIPDTLSQYERLRNLDLSNNQLSSIPESIVDCKNLTVFIARNNLLDEESFPKNFAKLASLTDVNFGGNLFTRIPDSILDLPNLISLHLGANHLTQLCTGIKKLNKLEVLYLGGNALMEIPYEVGELRHLKIFVLCENQLESLPSSVCNLKELKSLLLHRNRLTSLPVELIKLRNLMELSLRENPLVVRFVRDLTYNPPSLLELAGRTIKINKLQYGRNELPRSLYEYLNCAHECVNPKCKGVYFDTRVEHIKFVDFCGKYRIPLLQYLCSPKCSDNQVDDNHNTSDSDSEDVRIRKVLLG